MGYDLPTTDCLLVVRCNAFLNQKEFQELQRYICESKERHHAVLLPPYCEVLVVPKDIEIGFDPAHEHDREHISPHVHNVETEVGTADG